jgi:hypothetical protein
MNCCDSLLNEFSCRFCLGDAKTGNLISNYFRVEKRIVSSSEVFTAINLHVVFSPLVSNRICEECQTTIANFYSLKKNFQDNEAVLLGKLYEDSSGCNEEQQNSEGTEANVLPIVKDFLKENEEKSFNILKYTDRLTIECRE